MEYILIGDTGHAKVIRDSIEECGHRVVAILDDRYMEQEQKIDIIYGPLALLDAFLQTPDRKVIVAEGNNGIRKQFVERLALNEEQYGTIIHPTAIVSTYSNIGFGTVVLPGAIINPGSIVGNHCIINSLSVVEHDCRVASYVHLSTGVILTGNVHVEKGVHLGANATVIPNKKLGEWAIIGAGSAVIGDLPSGCTAVGCPARVLEK